jgi:DNA-binding CsgD family transcriptional regulator
LYPAEQEHIVAASCAELLAVLSGGRHVVPIEMPRRTDVMAHGIWHEINDLYALRSALHAQDWAFFAQYADSARSFVPTRNSARVDALLAPGLVAAGRRDAARERAVELARLGQTINAPGPTIEALLVLCELDCDPGPAFEALILAVQHNLVLAQIDALELLAVTYATAGQPEQAARMRATAEMERAVRDYAFRWPTRTELLGAVDIDDDAAIIPLDRACELALRGRGRRARPTTGIDALTPTELEVARQVASGLTNAEVAQRLHIQPSTVKTHLEHIYRKLGVQRRGGLATALSAHPGDNN